MHYARNENVDLYWDQADDPSRLLDQAAVLVATHDGVSRVLLTPAIDPDTNLFTYDLTVYLHG
jgi:hypothetical protein